MASKKNGTESFDDELDVEDIFGGDLVEIHRDIAGFWAPHEGEAVRGVLVGIRDDIPTAYGTRCYLLRIERGNPHALRAEGEEIRLEPGQVLGIWESDALARELAQAAPYRPEVAIQYTAMTKTKKGYDLRQYRIALEPRVARAMLSDDSSATGYLTEGDTPQIAEARAALNASLASDAERR